MANIKYMSAKRYQVGWYGELPDPYEDPNYGAHSTNNNPGQNAYWNFLGIDGSKIYESWIKFSFEEEEMLNPQQIGSVSFNLRFEFHKDRSSAKKAIPIICYIFPVNLDSAYKIKTTAQIEKDQKYVAKSEEVLVDFDNSYRKYTFPITLRSSSNSPLLNNTYFAVLKIHPSYETSGWNPVVWYGKDAVGGSLNSTTRAWKTTEIIPAEYEIYYKDENDKIIETYIAKYDSELGGSYITPIPTASKDYYTFKGWATTKNASVRDENLYKSTKGLGPFTSNTTLYPVFEKNTGTLEIRCNGITSDNCSIEELEENNHRVVVNPNKITVTYNTNAEVSISIRIITKPGYQFTDQTEEPFKYDLTKKIKCSTSENEKYDSITITDIEQINYTIQYQIGNFIVEKIPNINYGDAIDEKEITQAVLTFKNYTELGDFFEVYKSEDMSNELSIVSVITNFSITFSRLNWKEQVPENYTERSKTNIITLNADEGATLSFAIPKLTTTENTFATINDDSKITTFGQSISITDDGQGQATIVTYNPTDTIIDLTQTQINIWNDIGMGQNFTFVIPNEDEIEIYRPVGEYELKPKSEENGTLFAGGGIWWTTHQYSPFAEFCLDFSVEDSPPKLYLDKGTTLYSVKTSKKQLWVGDKYFDSESQTWIEGGN